MATKKKLSVRLLVAFTAACLVGVLGASGTADANTSPYAVATPGNDSAHPWSSNGCGSSGAGWVVPDSIWGVLNFNHACDHHDGCYGGFKVNGRPTRWVSRAQCDSEFYSDMIASCRWQHGWNLDATWSSRRCRDLAGTYHGAVRRLGSGSYSGPWNN